MSSKNMKIFIQICSHCKQHSWCTRHKEQVYLLLAKDIQTQVTQQHSDVQVLIVPVGGTKMGSFQISCEGISLFSKLKLGYFPHTNAVTQKISKFIQDFKNGKDLTSYQNNEQSPVKCNSNYNKSPSPKSSPMRKTNPTAFKINESTKKQQESNTHQIKQHNKPNHTQVKQTKPEVNNKKSQNIVQTKKQQQVQQKVQNQIKVSEKQKNVHRGQVILPKQQVKEHAKNNNHSQKEVEQKKKKSEEPVKSVQNVKNIQKNQEKHADIKKQNQTNKVQEKQKVKVKEEQTNFVIKDEVKQQKNEKSDSLASQNQHNQKSSHKQLQHQTKKQQQKLKQPEQNYEQQFEVQKQSTTKIVDQTEKKQTIQKVKTSQQTKTKEQPKQNINHQQEEHKKQNLEKTVQNHKEQTKKQSNQQKDEFQEDCKAAFSHYDKDKSGFLDKAEMNKFFNDLLNGMRLTPQKSQEFKAKFILQGDANNDGKIQFNELVAIARKIINS